MADNQNDYTSLIQEKLEKTVLEGYKSQEQFDTDVQNLLTSLGVTIEKLNTFLNEANNQGISPQAALDCYTLILKIK